MLAANTYTPQKSDKFSFGLWTVGNVGRDPFVEPVRAPLDPRRWRRGAVTPKSSTSC